tara:strand:+ start:197 stop:835 length:639 start_codon:yes stop_codon:yes gene_type:complete
MSSIKLPHASGNSVSIAAPQANPASDRTLYLPSNADGTVLTNTTPGCILQVICNTRSDVQAMTVSQVLTDIPGTDQSGAGSIYCIKITPSSTSNKVLFRVHLHWGATNDNPSGGVFYRDSTALTVGDTASQKKSLTFQAPYQVAADDSNLSMFPISYELLDSPNTTSEVVYKVKYWNHHTDDSYLNRSIRDFAGTTYDIRATSTLTAMEIAG